MNRIIVIGSSNIDFMGFPVNKLIPKDSNVGQVTISFGGVGRNICENLLRLGEKVTFFTCIGNDSYGKELEKELLDLKCNIISPVTNERSASYLCINDEHNDMVLAICDETISKHLNIEFLEKHKNILESSEYIIFDGNLDENVIDYIASNYDNKKLIADGISTTKVRKFINVMDKLYLFKVNQLEYEIIKECKFPQNLIVTRGSKSLEYYDGLWHEVKVIPAEEVVSTTGCGDALLSGTISSIVRGNNLDTAIQNGLALARKTLSVKESVYKQ